MNDLLLQNKEAQNAKDFSRLDKETCIDELSNLLAEIRLYEKEAGTDNYSTARLNALVLQNRKEDALVEIGKDHSNKEDSAYNLDCAMVYAIIGEKGKAAELIQKAIDSGFFRLKELRTIQSLKMLQELPQFEAIVSNKEAQIRKVYEEIKGQLHNSRNVSETSTIEVPFSKKGNMVYVKGDVNGLPLDFIFDTGCSDVSISNIEAAFMKKNGFLADEDFGSTEFYRTASGESCEGKAVNLKELRIGGATFKNIKASVLSGQSVPLLLGQSMMSRLANFHIDPQIRK